MDGTVAQWVALQPYSSRILSLILSLGGAVWILNVLEVFVWVFSGFSGCPQNLQIDELITNC